MDCAPEEPGEAPKDGEGKVIPGWKKKIKLKTPAPHQMWVDTDGVDPAVAGCHYAYEDEPNCKASKDRVATLPEKCDDDGNTLVETNPEAGKCHEHENGFGHPDTYDCNAYCKGKGKTKGKCVKVDDVCLDKDDKKTIASAKCECE